MTHAAQAAHDEGETVNGLALVVRELFDPLEIVVSSTSSEPESAEYGGVLVRTLHHERSVGSEGSEGERRRRGAPLSEADVRVRTGKITPTKVGLFVTHWRRTADGSTGPFGTEDCADTLLVVVSESGPDPSRGVFVLDRESLAARGVVARAGVGGKRGFRVYPPWSQTDPGQATRTQRWQLEHFVPLPLGPGDRDRARSLLGAPGVRPPVTRGRTWVSRGAPQA